MTNLESFLSLEIKQELARRNFADFVDYIYEGYRWNWHHVYICNKLQEFAEGKVKKLAIFIPPQHGKSELASKLFPAWLFGKRPDIRIAGVSYAHSLSAKFNRAIQRYMDDTKYQSVFPNTRLFSKNIRTISTGAYLRNSDEFEIVGYKGGYISVGIGGGLTGNKVDLLIIDDPVKDAVEASSTAFQSRNWEWYNNVASTRLNNFAQQLLIQTRWDTDDLGGLILKHDKDFKVIKIEAIKEDMSNDCDGYDKRMCGEALWEEEHNREKILSIKNNSAKTFYSLYQQEPQSPEEILVFASNSSMTNTAMPIGVKYYGMDFGFSNSQTAVCEIVIDNTNKIIDTREIVYDVGLSNHDIYSLLKQEVGNNLIIADSAEPKSIAELSSKGLNIVGIKKFPNSVLTMILHLREYTLRLRGQSFDFERRNYKWKINAEGKPLNEEVDKYNHLFKALMYAVYHVNVIGNVQPTSKQRLPERNNKYNFGRM